MNLNIRVSISRLLSVFASILMVFGLVLGFFSTGLGEMGQEKEVPLGDIDAIDVDANGNVYCATHTYDRIQVYARDGRFLRGLYVRMRAFEFDVDSSGVVHVWDDYNQYKRFGPEGEVLTEDPRDKPKTLTNHGLYVKQITDIEGNVYRVPWYAWCWPAIVKTTPSGQSSIVVSQPLHLWVIKVMCPAWFYVIFGVLYLGITRAFRR